MGAADGAGEDRAVLGIDVDGAALHLAEARDHPIRRQLLLRHAEFRALRLGQHEFFDEAAGVQKLVDALAGGELALGALFGGGFRVGVERLAL